MITYAKQPDQKYMARSSMRAMRVVAAASGTGVLWRKVSLGHGYVCSLVSFVVGLPWTLFREVIMNADGYFQYFQK